MMNVKPISPPNSEFSLIVLWYYTYYKNIR
jgi:hypothetical protein